MVCDYKEDAPVKGPSPNFTQCKKISLVVEINIFSTILKLFIFMKIINIMFK